MDTQYRNFLVLVLAMMERNGLQAVLMVLV